MRRELGACPRRRVDHDDRCPGFRPAPVEDPAAARGIRRERIADDDEPIAGGKLVVGEVFRVASLRPQQQLLVGLLDDETQFRGWPSPAPACSRRQLFARQIAIQQNCDRSVARGVEHGAQSLRETHCLRVFIRS